MQCQKYIAICSDYDIEFTSIQKYNPIYKCKNFTEIYNRKYSN